MPARLAPADRGADPGGLTTAEVATRRARYGRNDIVEHLAPPWWRVVADTAQDPMLWFLLVTSSLYAGIGDRLEALTLASAIVPLACMDAYLHRRTVASTGTLRARLAARARVRRDDVEAEVAAGELVPGDVVILGAGALVPADGLLMAGDDVQVDDSTLTGESLPIHKRPTLAWPPSAAGTVLVEGEHWLHAGTRVLAGSARVAVIFTGRETLYGEIARVAASSVAVRTPMQRAIDRLVMRLSGVAVLACAALALVRLAQGYGWTDALLSGLTLAVAALPEEFPVVFTLFLGVGVYRLARRHALVRRAAVVEQVGRITTICTDKTGTLTAGRLHLTHLVPAPETDEAGLLGRAAAAARPDSGDPLDVAIAACAGERGVDWAAGGWVRVSTFPFTEDRKRETAVLRSTDGALVATTKGAVETVLALVSRAGEEAGSWTARADELARGAHKVIACAWRNLPATWDGAEPVEGFVIAGLLACEDPVRPGVSAAIARCRAEGLRVLMLTGDHPLAASAVAREVGLGSGDPVVVTGDDLEARLAAGGTDGLAAVDVVARATPGQKLALVQALQAAGEVVAVTGDGVNDVPALRIADVGIAMGERGSESAREVAPIVLLDDDFATIVGAIGEGRQLFHNLRQSMRYLLMMHLPLVATAALLPLAGRPLLYLPIHVVWLELVMHPTAMLAFQGSASGASWPPRPRRATEVFTSSEWLGIAIVGIALGTLVAGAFLGALDEGSDVAHARAAALVTLALASSTLAAVLSGLRSAAAIVVTAATAVGTLVLVQTPACAARLHVTPLHAADLGAAAFSGVVVAALAVLLGRYAAQTAEGAASSAPGSGGEQGRATARAA